MPNTPVMPILPARSYAEAEVEMFTPSPAIRISTGHTPTPDNSSEQENSMVTGLLFQPPSFGAGAAAAETTGLARSILTVVLA